jgi:two-component system response regulator HydG
MGASIRPMTGPVVTADERRIVAVDDDGDVLRLVERLLTRAGFVVQTFGDPMRALEAMRASREPPDVVLSDIHMPGMTGLELLSAVRDSWPTLPVVLMTGKGTLDSAMQAVRLGAYDYLLKPFDPVDALVVAIRRAVEHKQLIERNRYLEQQLSDADRFEELVGRSAAMRDMFAMISSVAPTDTTVLILGESGTGKELVARAVHRQSPRSGRRFVAINCAALTESVLESELFGHVKGAFTGALQSRRGLFEEASGGTLFLDEIGELPHSTQVRLLRVLQEREIRPVGSNESRRVDVRIAAATHRDLQAAVEAGTFRQDLYYRLNVVRVDVPALRRRSDDIPLLVQHLIAKHSHRLGKQVMHVAPDALERLQRHDWPGNVRELENVVERAVVLGRGEAVTLDTLPPEIGGTVAPVAPVAVSGGAIATWNDARNGFEAAYLGRILDAADGNLSAAARMAGLDRSNFKRLLKRHGLLKALKG